MELRNITGNTYIIEAKAYIGLYVMAGGKCVLMDTGYRHEQPELEELLEREHLEPAALLCTHTHHDHFGNARYLHDRYGAQIILTLGEAAMCQSPAQWSSYVGFCSVGAFERSHNSRNVGQADVLITRVQDSVDICGERFGVVHTPGHSADHASFITPDGVCFAGDCLLSDTVMENSKMPFLYTCGEALASQRRLPECGAETFIISHRTVIGREEAKKLSEKNQAWFGQCLDDLLSCVRETLSLDELSLKMCARRKMQSGKPDKARAIRRIIESMAGYLIDEGELEAIAEAGIVKYRRTKA